MQKLINMLVVGALFIHMVLDTKEKVYQLNGVDSVPISKEYCLAEQGDVWDSADSKCILKLCGDGGQRVFRTLNTWDDFRPICTCFDGYHLAYEGTSEHCDQDSNTDVFYSGEGGDPVRASNHGVSI